MEEFVSNVPLQNTKWKWNQRRDLLHPLRKPSNWKVVIKLLHSNNAVNMVVMQKSMWISFEANAFGNRQTLEGSLAAKSSASLSPPPKKQLPNPSASTLFTATLFWQETHQLLFCTA